ncbi:hypothetical protein AMTR_s00119p00017050 [Amborella trichopoda]|uniref:Uncharacterized protein n=1 Tax=Amborella trichopoda TaxID=13333 RepID=W1NPZ5_AMBTC|nr:hypothetical protein AMTR_s00119p00017050 [Amborella trichopoda]
MQTQNTRKGLILAFDKIGRVCHVYLTRDHAILLHNLLNGDVIQAIAQFKKEVRFEDYRISSQNDDRSALAVDLGLLHRALQSSVSMDGDRLQIKLVKKRAVASVQPMPFLKFESKVLSLSFSCLTTSLSVAILFFSIWWFATGLQVCSHPSCASFQMRVGKTPREI